MKKDKQKREWMEPRESTVPIVRVVGASGWQIYVRADSPTDCVVINHFDKRMLTGRRDLKILVELLNAFIEAADTAYGPAH